MARTRPCAPTMSAAAPVASTSALSSSSSAVAPPSSASTPERSKRTLGGCARDQAAHLLPRPHRDRGSSAVRRSGTRCDGRRGRCARPETPAPPSCGPWQRSTNFRGQPEIRSSPRGPKGSRGGRIDGSRRQSDLARLERDRQHLVDRRRPDGSCICSRTDAGTSSRSPRLRSGRITSVRPAACAASTFCLTPPIGSTRPCSVTSPVMPTVCLHRPAGEQRGQRRRHGHARARAVLRDRAGRHVHVELAVGERPARRCRARRRGCARR